MSFVNYDALVRAIVSFLVPGLGQFINDEIEKGLKILVGFLIIWFALLFLNLFHIRTS